MVMEIRIQPLELPGVLKPGGAKRIFAQETKGVINEASTIIKPAMVAVSPFGGTNVLRRSWQIVPARQETLDVIAGGVRSTGPGSVAAIVIDEGADPHFPPVGETGEPALGTWIRRALPQLTNPFIVTKEGRRPADVDDPKDVRKLAFAIGRAINRRGFPRPGGQTGTFSKAFRKLTPTIVRIMNQLGPRIQLRIERER